MENMSSFIFEKKDLFFNDPDNPGETILKIPEHVLEQQGWKEGTKLKISIGDQGTIIIEEAEKKVDKSE